MAMENYAENTRDKSAPVTDPEALAVALSNVGTMSPRLRKLYDDAASVLRAQAADAQRFRWLAERTAATGLERWVHPFQFLCEAVDERMKADATMRD